MAELDVTALANDANLIAYYKLEGNSNDEQGSYNGTDTDITYGTSYGKYNQGALFNGSSSRISLGTTINPFGGNFTLSAWVKRGATGVASPIFGKYGATATDQWLYFYFDTDNALKVSFYADDTASTATVTDTTTWHHVAFVYTYSTKLRELYLDGTLVKSAAGTGNPNFGSNALYIGSLQFGSPIYFNGSIDDVAVFNRALTAAEVLQLYKAGTSGASFLLEF